MEKPNIKYGRPGTYRGTVTYIGESLIIIATELSVHFFTKRKGLYVLSSMTGSIAVEPDFREKVLKRIDELYGKPELEEYLSQLDSQIE